MPARDIVFPSMDFSFSSGGFFDKEMYISRKDLLLFFSRMENRSEAPETKQIVNALFNYFSGMEEV